MLDRVRERVVRILNSAPKPDPEYWNIVEAITRNQPKLSS